MLKSMGPDEVDLWILSEKKKTRGTTGQQYDSMLIL